MRVCVCVLVHAILLYFCSHLQVKAVSFTGGTATGSEVAASAARRFAKVLY